MTSRREATISECGWNLLSVSFIAALMYDGFSTLYTGAFLVFALIIGIMLVRTDASRGKWFACCLELRLSYCRFSISEFYLR